VRSSAGAQEVRVRRVLIVGAGQSGLQLALTLQSAGYDVTMMSAQTPDELRRGRIKSTQCMFAPALQLERDHDLNLWEDQAPKIRAQRVTLSAPPGTRAFSFAGEWESYAQSVDQRLKMAGWLELLEEEGGRVIYNSVTTSDLDGLATLGRYDLTIVAAGKGELVDLFDRDPSRSPYTSPQRMLACAYVHGVPFAPEYPDHAVSINPVPGVGELYFMPGLTMTGPCEILLWEAVPTGPLGNGWADRLGPAEHLQRMLEAMREYAPWEYDRCASVELTDARATLTGGYTPVVRDPVGKLPAGGRVLGMADVVVANDPITGQGANNAAHCAAIYLQQILDHGDRPFDEAWMRQTFEAYWAYAGPVTEFTNAMLGEMPEHVQRILATAAVNPTVAARFSHGYAHPDDFQHWLMDPAKADAYLAEVAPA
jgi:2-polyprenyl-6-methoxyphenol hydroxylase-like FAD-dependent oxidoreductase